MEPTDAVPSSQQMTVFLSSSSYYLQVSSSVCHLFELLCNRSFVSAAATPLAVRTVMTSSTLSIVRADASGLPACIGLVRRVLHTAPCEQHRKSAEYRALDWREGWKESAGKGGVVERRGGGRGSMKEMERRRGLKETEVGVVGRLRGWGNK